MSEAAKIRAWLDDERPVPLIRLDQGFVIFRFADDLIKRVEANEVEFIDFDHDLGLGYSTGYDVAKRIEQLAAEGRIDPIKYRVHSGNAVGAANIEAAMESAWRFWRDRASGGIL